MLKYLTLLLLPISFCHSATLVKQEKIELSKCTLIIEKIEFDGHTYIHFTNRWNQAANKIVHDPRCKGCYDDAMNTLKAIKD